MPQTLTAYRVFIASPGGLVAERQAFRDAIQTYNEVDALSRGVLFVPVGWEQTLPGIGRPQSLINEDLRDCDYFVLMLWDRWGSPSGDASYSSGTGEEYGVARECCSDPRHCLREIAAFFKAVEPRQMSDPGEQLRQVLDFRRRLEQTKELLFSTFDDAQSFQRQIERLLAKWVRDHEQGRCGKAAKSPPAAAALGELTPEGLASATSATAGLTGLGRSRAVVEEAQQLAAEGRLTDAETLFARAVVKDNEPETAIQYARFLRRLGRFSQAQALLEGILERQASGEELWKAGAYNYLGMLCRDRGDLDEAEQMLNQAKAYEDHPGGRETTIAAYNNLGQVFRDRGDLTQAEIMHLSALKLCLDGGSESGLGGAYGNLAHIYLIRGEWESSAEMNRKALELTAKRGNEEGHAIALRNQGLLLIEQQKLAEAEAALRRSLELATKIGRQKSIADANASLARLSLAQGDHANAELLLAKAIEVNERIGRRKGIARAFGLLGEVQLKRGDVSQAERSLLRAIETARPLQDRICLANACVALGSIFERRGETTAASLLWQEARQHFASVGVPGRLREVDLMLAQARTAAT